MTGQPEPDAHDVVAGLPLPHVARPRPPGTYFLRAVDDGWMDESEAPARGMFWHYPHRHNHSPSATTPRTNPPPQPLISPHPHPPPPPKNINSRWCSTSATSTPARGSPTSPAPSWACATGWRAASATTVRADGRPLLHAPPPTTITHRSNPPTYPHSHPHTPPPRPTHTHIYTHTPPTTAGHYSVCPKKYYSGWFTAIVSGFGLTNLGYWQLLVSSKPA